MPDENFSKKKTPVAEETLTAGVNNSSKKSKKKKHPKSSKKLKTTKEEKQNTKGKTKSKQPKMVDRETAIIIEESGLPPHVTSWEILPHPLDEETEILVFYVGSTPTTHIEITGENIGNMMTELNSRLIIPGDTITAWSIRTPTDPTMPPRLSLVSGDAILGSLLLTDDVLEHFVPKLNKLYTPKPPLKSRFIRWVKKHPIWASILLIPPVIFLLYNIGTQIYISISQQFS